MKEKRWYFRAEGNLYIINHWDENLATSISIVKEEDFKFYSSKFHLRKAENFQKGS